MSLRRDMGPDKPGFRGLIRRFAPRVALGVAIGVIAVLIGGRSAHAGHDPVHVGSANSAPAPQQGTFSLVFSNHEA